MDVWTPAPLYIKNEINNLKQEILFCLVHAGRVIVS